MKIIFGKFLVITVLLVGFYLIPAQPAKAQGLHGIITILVGDSNHQNEVFTFDGAFGTFYLTDWSNDSIQYYTGIAPGTYSFSTRIKPGHAVYQIYCGLMTGGYCTYNLANRSVTITLSNTINSYVSVGFYRN